jgi:hypothetical protein
LARGGKRAEVREVLLPKAELREARALGSVDAIERYLDSHRTSKIAADIETALRDALLLELKDISQTGSLSSLRAFRKGDPHLDLIRPQLDIAERNVEKAALAKFQSLAKNSPELVAFFEKLVRYASQHGPTVEIRFRRRIPPSFEKADAQVRKSPFCKDASVPPAQYFNDERFAKREATVAAAISQRFADAFPKDILTFELAPVLPDDGTPIPTVTVPTLLITHRTELSPPFTSLKPKGVYVGLGVVFKAVLLIPGGPTTRPFDSSTWSAPVLKKLEAESWGPAELYEFMAQDAFDQFRRRFLQNVFRSAN